jgi:iron complex transport system ATP-binding protein
MIPQVHHAAAEAAPGAAGLAGRRLTVRYSPNRKPVLADQSIDIPVGKITAIIGPNGSGKSTLLKTLARQLAPQPGCVLLDGKDISHEPRRLLARRLGVLFQENVAPNDLSVEELVFHGRYPHRRLFESFQEEDLAAVEHAIRMAGIDALRHQLISQLSAGQKQLAWIAMALAQGTDYLLLDEPTTFLDLAHQLEVMNLIRRLNHDLGKTLVLVLHDLNLSARYADTIAAMRDGRIVVTGAPEEALTERTLREVFGVEAQIIHDAEGRIIACNPLRVLAPCPAATVTEGGGGFDTHDH